MTEKTNTLMDGVVETVKTIVYALLIAGFVRTIFFQPFWIPSGSMKDTLLIGDFLFVNKMVYGYSRYSCPFGMCPFDGRIWSGEPERGDVVVFRHPVNGQDFIKRVVGLPGDTVQMRSGVLHINGSPAPQLPDGNFVESYARQGPIGTLPICVESSPRFGDDCTKEKSIETLPNGKQHAVLDVGLSRVDNTGVFRVPPAMYFFMGDNRDNSTDSRVSQSEGGVGLVPLENLIGRADRVMFSSAGRSLFFVWTWRVDRFFKKIN